MPQTQVTEHKCLVQKACLYFTGSSKLALTFIATGKNQKIIYLSQEKRAQPTGRNFREFRILPTVESVRGQFACLPPDQKIWGSLAIHSLLRNHPLFSQRARHPAPQTHPQRSGNTHQTVTGPRRPSRQPGTSPRCRCSGARP